MKARADRCLFLAVAAVTAIIIAPAYAADAESVLVPEADKALTECITKTEPKTPPKLCVKDIAPPGQNLLKNCALTFCVAAPPEQAPPANPSLDPEQAQKLLLQILGSVKDVNVADSPFRDAADQLEKSILALLANVQEGREVAANLWSESDQANPIKDVYDKLNARCANLLADGTGNGAQDCSRDAKQVLKLRFASEATRRTVQRLHWQAVEQSVACIKRLGDRYDAYFDAARFQWPWELWLNSKIYAKGNADPQCGGFKDVPSQQVVLLHPSIGFRYSEDAQQKFGATFLVELVGLRRWAWSGGDAVNMRGASLVMSYSNQVDAKDVGWGFLVNLRNDVSLGLVWHQSSADNKISLIFSYDFGKLVSDDPQEACKKLFESKGCSLLKK